MPTSAAKLPMARTIARAYGSLVENPGLFARAGWAWMAVAYTAQLASAVFAVRYAGTTAHLLALTAFAVQWHRGIMLGERPRGLIHLRVGREEARYFLLGLLLTVAILGPPYLLWRQAVAALPHASGLTAALIMVGILAVVAAILIAVTRLTLVYPATAIGAFAFGFERSWRLTHGNTWRILGGAVLAILPWTAISMTLDTLFKDMAAAPGALTATALLLAAEIAISFAEIAVCAAFLSYAYEFIVGGKEAEVRLDAQA
ncbi:MAG: hypothetical protein HYW28_08875 [Rhodospirillales bacterium]|nr:hypothetical protein [Rhodospirillales bacterium]